MKTATRLTPSGPIIGLETEQGQVYKGIPFATPPVGDLRFRAPQAVTWQRPLEATQFKKAAMQVSNAFSPVGETSEDCLYLNVWAPAKQSGSDTTKPVLVWLHGGSFLTGAGSMAMYHGDSLAQNENVIVVTLNYRLGAFGFVHWSVLDDNFNGDTNLGLRDILCSLQWIQDNIEAFGGDPDNVTVFGESAGAIALACLITSPLRDGLFRRAIIQSGTPDQVISKSAAEKVCHALLNELQIDKHSLNQLRAVPASKLLDAQQVCQKMSVQRGEHPVKLPLFEATMSPLFGDDLLPKPPLAALAEGAANNLDIIAGTMLNEWDLFLRLKRGEPCVTQNPKYQQLDEVGVLKLFQRGLPDHAQKALDFYRSTRDYGESGAALLAVYSDFESDRTFNIPTFSLAEAQARIDRPIYHYEITWDAGMFGAAHGADIPLTFGKLEGAYAKMFCGEAMGLQTFSQQLQHLWCSFAETGIPTCPSMMDWPVYTLDTRHTLLLGTTNDLVRDRKLAELEFWQSYF